MSLGINKFSYASFREKENRQMKSAENLNHLAKSFKAPNTSEYEPKAGNK